MTFKPAIWYPITVVLSAFNLVAVGFTAAEPWHAATHAALALGFGLWAQRLRQGLRGRGADWVRTLSTGRVASWDGAACGRGGRARRVRPRARGEHSLVVRRNPRPTVAAHRTRRLAGDHCCPGVSDGACRGSRAGSIVAARLAEQLGARDQFRSYAGGRVARSFALVLSSQSSKPRSHGTNGWHHVASENRDPRLRLSGGLHRAGRKSHAGGRGGRRSSLADQGTCGRLREAAPHPAYLHRLPRAAARS